MRTQRRLNLVVSSALGAALLWPGISVAQDVAAQDTVGQAEAAPGEQAEAAPSGINDIVVTAQRTASTVQRTPIAITAADAELLQQRQIKDVKDIGSLVPGLLVEPVSSSSNGARIVLRGVGQEQGGILYDPGVAVYIDGVYQPRINGSFFDFFDIERLEVLRGPQGTLYGRNSSGGAIKIITRTPSVYSAEASGDLAYGSHDTFSARGYASVPIVLDKLAMSASFVKRNRDGFITSTKTGEKLGKVDTFAARAKLYYTPSSRFEATLAVDYMQDRGDSGIGVPLTVYPGVDNPHATPDRDIYTTELDGPQQSDVDSIGASANLRYELSDSVALTSITGYRWLNLKQASDFAQLAAGYDLGGDYKVSDHSFSQELDLEVETGPIKGVVGLYYFNERGTQVRGYLGVPQGYSTPNTLRRKTEAVAAFAEVSAEIFTDFNLIGGIRWTKEDAYLSQIYPTVYDTLQVAKDSFSDVTPKIGFNWQVAPEAMIYASYTQGFKSGGFNNITPSVDPVTGEHRGPEVYHPETVESYEAGIKFTSPDRHLRLNLAVFQADYKGLQLPALIPGTAVSTTRNATSARIQGIEIEPTWRPTDGLEFYGALAFSYGEYTGPYSCADTAGVFVDCSNNSIKGLIPEQVTLGFNFEPQLDMPGQISLGGDWQYTSFYYNNVSNETVLAQSQPLSLFNGFIKWTSPNSTWSVALEARNLTDKKYYRNSLLLSNATSPSTTIYPGEPRIVSVRLGFNF